MSSGYYCEDLIGTTGVNTTYAYVANVFQVPFSGSTNTTLTNIRRGGTALQFVTYSVGTKLPNCGYQQSGTDISQTLQPVAGEKLFTTPGATGWTCPSNVYSVSIVAVGGGGTSSYYFSPTFFNGSSGTASYFRTPANSNVVYAGGGQGGSLVSGAGGVVDGAAGFVGFAGGAGGQGYNNYLGFGTSYTGGGGGAGGYSSAGGVGGDAPISLQGANSTSGGGGGGGAIYGGFAGAGGGVGIYPTAISGGTGGAGTTNPSGGVAAAGTAGGEGSGVTYGGTTSSYSTTNGAYGCGGGGGGLAYITNYAVTPGSVYPVQVGAGGTPGSSISVPGGGAVRIVWGYGRNFPYTGISTAFNPT